MGYITPVVSLYALCVCVCVCVCVCILGGNGSHHFQWEQSELNFEVTNLINRSSAKLSSYILI